MKTDYKFGDWFKRHGVTIGQAKWLCFQLGLNPNRHLLFAAQLLKLMQ